MFATFLAWYMTFLAITNCFLAMFTKNLGYETMILKFFYLAVAITSAGMAFFMFGLRIMGA